MKARTRKRRAAALAMCAVMTASLFGETKVAFAAEGNSARSSNIHVYAPTGDDPATEANESQDVASAKYTLSADGTEIPVVQFNKKGHNFDVARFASDTRSPEFRVTVNEDIKSVKVYPERYYPQESLTVSADKRTLTFQMSAEAQLNSVIVMINGDANNKTGQPYLAILNDPLEQSAPSPSASNVLNFKEFAEQYLQDHPNATEQQPIAAGQASFKLSEGTANEKEYTYSHEAGQIVDASNVNVRYPDQRRMSADDMSYAFQAALDKIYSDSSLDTLYFPNGTYTYAGLQIRNRKGKNVTIYLEEGALLKNRIQSCAEAMEPAIGIWDSENITISGRGMFDGNGVENYWKQNGNKSGDRNDANMSCHQAGVMVVRSSNVTFNDTYMRNAKQWNWEAHSGKNIELNNIKGLTPYSMSWGDGTDMAGAQDLTINGAFTLGNDDCFASGHYNPSRWFAPEKADFYSKEFGLTSFKPEDNNAEDENFKRFSNAVAGYVAYNSDNDKWDAADSYNITVNNTLQWSYYGGNGIRLGHEAHGYQLKNYTFNNLNALGFAGGGCGITVQNHTDIYPRYETLKFINCSFDTSRAGNNFLINGGGGGTQNAMGKSGDLNGDTDGYTGQTITKNPIDTVIMENCWFSKQDATCSVTNVENLTINDLYIGGKKVEASTDVNLATTNVTNLTKDWADNHAPEFTAPTKTVYEASIGEELAFAVTAEDADADDTLSITADGVPEGAHFDAAAGTFTWTPTEKQAGKYKVTFTAEDKWGASATLEIAITAKTDSYDIIEAAPTEDTYMASWKSQKNDKYEGNEYLRVMRMRQSIADSVTYGLWGEKITSTSDDKDAKISVLKFDAADLKKNLSNLHKAELELTLINRRNSGDTGNDRLMAAAVTSDWNAANVTWNTHPTWNADAIKYSDEFKVDTNGVVKNDVAITASSYDGTKVAIDVTDFVKNLKEEDTTLSIAVCDENGYELAFASTEGAAKLGSSKEAAPVLRLTMKKVLGPEVEVGKLTASDDAFVGSWSGDKTKNYGSNNFLRVSYGNDSQGVLGSTGGGDNKLTYLKFNLSSLEADSYDKVKLQLALLGVRKNEAANQETELLVGTVADDWSEGTLTWNNKPAVTTAEADVTVSDTFTLGSVVNNDPAKINAPDGTMITVDVTNLVKAAQAAGKDSVTFVLNANNGNAAMTSADANRYYFVSKEGAANYAGAADMAPTLVLTKYGEADEKMLSSIKITSAPDKTRYKLGEALNTAGLEVTAVYSDDSTEVLALDTVTLSGFDSDTMGKKTVTVTYEGKTATFDVAVVDYKSFTPNSQWLDTDGNMIQAHGGGIIFDAKTQKYYWYGENKGEDGFSAAIGVSCYSSSDLYNWTYEGMALPVFNNPAFLGADYTADTPLYLAESSKEYQAAKKAGAAVSTYDTLEKYNSADAISAMNELYKGMTAAEKKALYDKLNWNCVVERPKVIYNDKTKKYVMWFHKDGEGVGTYNLAETGIAVSDSPTGPFKLVDSIRPNNHESRDMTLFKDDDGKAYLIYSSEDNWTLHIAEMNEDYTGLTGKYSRNYVDKSGSKGVYAREAPAVFKQDGKYYIISSGCTGWDPNQMGYSVTGDITTGMTADGGTGPFQMTELLNPCIGTNAGKTFGGQSAYVLPVQGKAGCFIYMGDKWNKNNLKDSRYQWLPIQVDSSKSALTISWNDEWTLNDFNTLNTSERRAMNAAVKEGSALSQAQYGGTESWEELQRLLTEAGDLDYGTSKADVAALTKAITDVIAGIEKWHELDAALEAVEALDEVAYTKATWSDVQAAYLKGKELKKNEKATESDIKKAASEILTAIDKLEGVEMEAVDLTGATATASSSQSGYGPEKALDGQDNTHWHSSWANGHGTVPIDFVIDLGKTVDDLCQLVYLPRQDKKSNGSNEYNGDILSYEVWVSDTGADDSYTKVKEGSWADDKSEKTATFVPVAARYVKLVATATKGNRESDYNQFASASKIGLKTAVPYVTGIKAELKADKKEYKLGEKLGADDLSVTATYSNGSTAKIDAADVEISGFDTKKPGKKTVTVTYEGQTATFEMTVINEIADGVAITGLRLDKAPAKTVYKVDEEKIILTGMELYAIYEGGIEIELAADDAKLAVSGFDSSAVAASQTITLTYEGQTATFDIAVAEELPEVTLESIRVTAPDKTEYATGEELDTAGMKVTAYYSDGTSKEIALEDVTITGFDSSKESLGQTVTVAYEGKEDTFTVNVTGEPVLHKHTMVKVPAKKATCTENGNIEYYGCEECGKFFKDKEGTKEITLADTLIKATGHVWDKGVVTVKPTTEAQGERTYTCKVCGATRTEVIPKLAHAGKEQVGNQNSGNQKPANQNGGKTAATVLSKKEAKTGTTSANTGDAAPIGTLAGLGATALLAAAVLRKRRMRA